MPAEGLQSPVSTTRRIRSLHRRRDHGDDKLEGQRKHRGQPARSDLQIQAANLREFVREF
jgi:hypothetical protein